MRPPVREISDYASLLEHLPSSTGPATSRLRHAIWTKAGGSATTPPVAAMDHAMHYISELERQLPATAKPLVMHSFQAAMDVSSEFARLATDDRVGSGEMFRLVLVAMRQYLELYALIGGGRGTTWGDFTGSSQPLRPVVVTIAEFRQALPLLTKWGIHVPHVEERFALLDPSGVGVVRFDDFARWAMRTQLEYLADSILLSLPPRGPTRRAELTTDALALSLPGATRGYVFEGQKSPGLGRPRSAGRLCFGSPSPPRSRVHKRLEPYVASGFAGVHARPRARKFDLGDALKAVGLQQYYRGLSEMGFDDVEQLLSLQLSSDDRDAARLSQQSYAFVLDKLNLMPGHRERMVLFFQNETRRAAKAVAAKVREQRNVHARHMAAADGLHGPELRELRAKVAALEEELLHGRVHADAAVEAAKAAWAKNEKAEKRANLFLGKAAPKLVGGVIGSAWRSVMLPVFRGWKDEVRSTRVARRFAHRARNVGLSRAWNKWCDEVECRVRLMFMLQRWQRVGLSRAFNKWCDRSDSLSEREKATTVLRSVVAKFLNAKLLAGFNTWCEMVEARFHNRKMMMKVATRFKKTNVATAFYTWSSTATLMIEKKRQVRRALSRSFANGDLGRAWNTWAALMDNFRKIRRVMRRLVHARLAIAWSTWLHGAGESAAEARKRRTAHQLLSRLTHGQVGAAWNSWVEFVERRHDVTEQLRRVASRLLNAGMSKAFYQWAEQAEALSEQLAVLTKYLARMLDAHLHAGFEQWASRARDLKTIERAFNAYGNQLLFRTFGGWCLYVEQHSSKNRSAVAKAASYVAKKVNTFFGGGSPEKKKEAKDAKAKGGKKGSVFGKRASTKVEPAHELPGAAEAAGRGQPSFMPTVDQQHRSVGRTLFHADARDEGEEFSADEEARNRRSSPSDEHHRRSPWSPRRSPAHDHRRSPAHDHRRSPAHDPWAGAGAIGGGPRVMTQHPSDPRTALQPIAARVFTASRGSGAMRPPMKVL